MRIISGTRRGKKLLAPDGLDTRPTLDRIKQKMFDCIQFDIADRKVLDLFAGSGQLGLEALSRGAKSCHFNDADRGALSVVQKNISACEFEKMSSLTCNLYTDCVTICKSKGMSFSLVFLDPPYQQGLIDKALAALSESDILESGALIVCEYAAGEQLKLPEGIRFIKEKKSGLACFSILGKEEVD